MNYFFDNHKYKTIPISLTIQNHSMNSEYKYNYSNHLNQIESLKGSTATNSYLKTENDSNEKIINRVEQKGINSINNLSIKRKRIFNNNINILKFNEDICSKKPNSDFTGKKIMLSKYPLLNRNKISTNKNNKNKTLEINTTFFDKNFDQKYLNINKGDYLLTKIEKELNALLNKQKNDSIESHKDTNKTQYNKSFYSLINNSNDSKIKLKNLLFNENLINKENNGKVSIKKNIKRNLFNQYLDSNLIKRNVLFIDKNNNTLKNDNTITLLSGEKDLLFDIYMSNKDNKGNEINLPLLQRYNKAANEGKFLTEFNNKFLNQNKNGDPTKSGSLSKLIKDKFTMQNYKNIKIAGTTKEYAYYNPNFTNNDTIFDETLESLNLNIGKNKNSVFPKENRRNRTKKEKRRQSILNDIFGFINAKTILPKTKKNQNKYKKIEIKNKTEEKVKIKKHHKKKQLNITSSQPNIITSIYQKFLKDKEKEINKILNIPIYIRDRNKKIRVTLIKKESKIIPIDENKEEIKNPRILISLYEEIKSMINDPKQKLGLPRKRLSCDPLSIFINPIKIAETQNESSSSTSSSIITPKSNKEEKPIIQLKDFIDNKQNNEKKEKEKNIIQPKTKSPFRRKGSSLITENNKSPKHVKSPMKEKTKQKRKSISKHVKIEDNKDNFYKEEDDFLKDFNFDFDTSDDETSSASIQKLMRLTRKKLNKYLFQIFEYISKNISDIDTFKKEDLIKLLIDRDFRNQFRLLKDQIVKLRELERDSLDPEGKDKNKKIYIRDMEIINYIFRYIKDKNSLFYKSIYKRIKKEQEEENKFEGKNNYDKMFDLLNQSSKDLTKKRIFSLYSKRKREYAEDKGGNHKHNSKKFVKKKVAGGGLEFISQDEKKKLILSEINLTNEIRYQISIANDKESKEKFKNLLNKIEALRNLSGDEYVKSLKDNFLMFKEEADEILKAKEIEERLNGFIDDLNYQRNNLKDKHKYIMSSMFIKDNKFLSSFENE